MQIHEYVFVRHQSNIFLFVHEYYRRNRLDIFKEKSLIESFRFSSSYFRSIIDANETIYF
jgi:hypothetical protein